MDKIKVGGQAILEGVMMITPKSWGLAVRQENGEIITKSWKRKSALDKNSFARLPVIRGFIVLFETLLLGYRALDLSSQLLMKDQKKSWKDDFIMFFSLAFALLFFFSLPLIITKYSFPNIYKDNQFLLNLIVGSLRLVFFILYVAGISFLKDVKRVFQYHGAEHKAIYCYESGQELTPENAIKFGKEHPRCGTSLILVTVVFAIIFSAIFDTFIFNIFSLSNTPLIRTAVHVLYIPFIAGLAYEFNRFGSNHMNNPFFKILVFPGLIMQKLTTKTPDIEQMEVSIDALKASIEEHGDAV
ncbi:DUF1385 domain-containing protein [candidate division WOR-3 bacterium]|nr:DUF1385 domain-containing protein [candidate division WOR-3 bacterium]